MAKSSNITINMIEIFFKSFKIYFQNLPKFVSYMAFPVFGCLFGSIYILTVAYSFSEFLTKNGENNFIFNSVFFSLFIFILVLIPGFLVFCKAFLDYIIAMSTTSRAALDLIATDELVKDLKSYHSVLEKREKHFILLIALLSMAYGILSFPILWLVGLVFFLYSCLSIQAFAANENFGGFTSIRRSFLLIPGHVPTTIVLLLLLGFTTYCLIPECIWWLLKAGGISPYLGVPMKALLAKMGVVETLLPVVNDVINNIGINFVLTFEMIVENTTKLILLITVSAFLLPIRSIACMFWYKRLNDGATGNSETAKKMAKKAKEKE